MSVNEVNPRVGPVRPTLLVVEDNDDLRDMMQTWFEARDFHVATASNGAEALAWIGAGHWPSLIVLDLMMPVMSGFEVLEWLGTRDALASIPVIVTSADHERGAKVKHFMSKPLDIERLTALVDTLCGRAAPTDDGVLDRQVL